MVQGELLTVHPVGKHPWWWRSSRRWFLPPAGCREEVSWCSRSWKRGGGETEDRSRKRVPLLGVSRHEEYMGEGGQPRGPPGVQVAPWRGPTLGRLGPWWVPSSASLVIPEASEALIFYWIFPNFWSTFNMGET